MRRNAPAVSPVPAVGREVVVCDARPPRRLVVGDVGRQQRTAVQAHVSDGMPAQQATPVSVGSRRPLGARRSHLLCISHSLLPILISHTHTRPSPPPLTTFQSSARTDVTPSWCAYKDDTQEPERRSNTRTLGTKHTNSRKKNGTVGLKKFKSQDWVIYFYILKDFCCFLK